ncbi:Glycosyltransferase [hydrothermal vent metagenome]|uniref:Glycosyltransferase n=1 Tax=hydrothermal vent metagenome TaxID=652676 RepID=A0A1W1CZK3_9ZZZZ
MVLGVIIPCYNEEEMLEETSRQLSALLFEMIENKAIDKQSFICFVDDGSTDKSWQIIETLKEKNICFKGIKLSRNFGHQNALIAGLMQMKEKADALISMDADLQDDIRLIPQFVEKYKEGYEIVYGVRNDRKSDSLSKRKTANFFYKFQHFMGIESIEHHADYRLLSQKSLNALAHFEEVQLFLRGIVPMLGFRSCSLFYKREKRFAGESKYPLRKMLGFALDGITSFSIRPLRFITAIGFLLFLLSILGIIWVFIEKFILGNTVQGWSSMMVSIYFIGGIQIMSLGIIGEYVGRNYQQSKGRPRYIIEEEI